MNQLRDRLERDLREIAAGAHPSPSAWESILARLDDDAEPEVILVLAPAPNRSKRPVWLAVAAAALVVIIGSIAVVPRAVDDQTTSPADPDETTVDFPNLTTTFVSPRNGFSIKHPDGAEVTPATQLLDSSEQVDDGFDVVETGLAAVFKGASTDLREAGPDGVSSDQRVDEYLSFDYDGCGVPRSQQAEITIDGQPGRIAECPNHIEATVVAGGRLYVFTLSHDRSDPRAVFDAFAATIDLTPETAVNFPAMATTFVSPTNGFSFKYHDRGGLAPATELWDPVIDPPADTSGAHDGPFDGVETGYGAYFKAASTEIPDGVAIDAWVDEYISPGGCSVPRSQQAEITIDGQAGRIAECADRVEATVVAGGRLYFFLLLHSRSDARAWFDAWVATIDLTPETAAVP